MANRFTAPEKWVDPWFCGLDNQDKLFWIYICDNCDHAGIWQVNWPLVKFHIKDFEFDKNIFNGRIEIINESTWFLKKFVLFQQKVSSLENLNPLNKCHLSIINILKSKEIIKPLSSPLQGACKGSRYSIGNSKVIVRGGMGGKFEEVWDKYPNKVGKNAAQRHFEATVKTEKDFLDIQTALENYLVSERVKKGFVQNGSTWFNDWQGWLSQPGVPKTELEKWIASKKTKV